MDSLTREEERRLFKQIAENQGNVQAARKRIILANLRMVVRVAARYARSGKRLIRLVEQGNLALLKAMDRYDYCKNYRFSTYALWHVRNAMRKS